MRHSLWAGSIVVPEKQEKEMRALQAAEKLSKADVLKGHGFIRANRSRKPMF
jgi:hypothetical protein